MEIRKVNGEDDENTLYRCMKLWGNNVKILHRVFLQNFMLRKERTFLNRCIPLL